MRDRAKHVKVAGFGASLLLRSQTGISTAQIPYQAFAKSASIHEKDDSSKLFVVGFCFSGAFGSPISDPLRVQMHRSLHGTRIG